MKRIFKKNQIIITTLAIMIAVAGYLNYSGRVLEDRVSTVNTIGSDDNLLLVTDDYTVDSTYADTYSDILSLEDDGVEETALNGSSEGSAGIGEAVLANSSSAGDSILAAAKLNREQIRARSKEELQTILDSADLGDEERENVVSAMAQMTKTAEQEADAELLLEAKGYIGCVVSITDDTADVIVNAAKLNDSQRAQIEDIVKRKTGIPGENIIITPQS